MKNFVELTQAEKSMVSGGANVTFALEYDAIYVKRFGEFLGLGVGSVVAAFLILKLFSNPDSVNIANGGVVTEYNAIAAIAVTVPLICQRIGALLFSA